MTENKKIEPRLLQGFRDFLPDKKIQRDYLINTVRQVYESFGFLPLETPALEYAEVLTGKYGEEASTLMYGFQDRGKRDVAMRYDLTVPFSRVIAQYPELPKPFKRYQVAPVWRAESPQQGRYREFYQFDADVAGSSSMLADAEIISLIYTVMTKLGIEKFSIKINNRKILTALIEFVGLEKSKMTKVCQIIDKIEKIGSEGVKKELLENFDPKTSEKIMSFLAISGQNEEILDQIEKLFTGIGIAQDGIEELREVLLYAKNLDVSADKIKIMPSIARGLDYYTGTVFETELSDLTEFGSVFSGGRFDNLVGVFSNENVPAVGASVGIDRLFAAMEKLEILPKIKSPSQVLVSIFPENIADSLKIVSDLRKKDMNAEIFLGNNLNLKSQLKYADKQSIPLLVITFPDIIEKGNIIVRQMVSGEQTEIPIKDLPVYLKKMISN